MSQAHDENTESIERRNCGWAHAPQQQPKAWSTCWTSNSARHAIRWCGRQAGPQRYTYAVIAEYPHDPAAFTQGLVFWKGSLYESTGEYRKSGLRRTKVETGEVTQQVVVAPQYFAWV
jgi:glutamine cyclotransferase